MKILTAVLICISIIAFSCSDRDDNLEGVQIRVKNASATTFSEVKIDSLVFADLEPDDLAFYQQFNGLELPDTIELISDSLNFNVTIDTVFVIDSLQLQLFTYRIKESTESIEVVEVEVLKD